MLGRVVPCWSAQQQPWNSFKGRAVPPSEQKSASWPEAKHGELGDKQKGCESGGGREGFLQAGKEQELSSLGTIGGDCPHGIASCKGQGSVHTVGQREEGSELLKERSQLLSALLLLVLLHLAINTGMLSDTGMLSGQKFLDIF